MSELATDRRPALAAMYALDLRVAKFALLLASALALVSAASLVVTGSNFALTLTAMIVMLPMLNFFQVIETGGLDRLFGSLPVGRRSVVRAHYLVLASVTALACLPWLVGALVHLVLPNRGVRGEALAFGLATVAATALVVAVEIPAILKWGSRVAAPLIFLITALGVGLVVAVASSSARGGAHIPTAALVSLAAVLLLGGVYASYLASVRIYARKEF